jgi:hypothetical protein
VGIVEHRASGHGKLVVTLFAVENLFFGFEFDNFSFAPWALGTVRPAQPDQQFTTFIFGRKQSVYVN